jgi:HD-GYP domain-containing protein (c-di-GMP phosphodiesterase class II)
VDVRSLNILRNFRRRIVLRLVAVALIASSVCAVTVFAVESQWLNRVCANLAALEAQRLAGMMTGDGVRPDVAVALRTFLHSSAHASRDYFVAAEMQDRNGETVAKAVLDDFASVQATFERCRLRLYPGQIALCSQKIINHSVFVRVTVPLIDGEGPEIGRFEGIYRLSPETMATIERDNSKIVLVTVATMLLTLLALYPLMASLQGHVVTEALKALGSAIAKRDSDTNAHNFRVTLYAVRIAEDLGLSDAAIRSLIKGALLHDVGKIAIHDAILLKPGPLNPQERREMMTHVAHGLDIIGACGWLKDAAAVVGGHHEKVDGSGYPHGLAGDAVPLVARIFAIADVFDALTAARPYKAAMPVNLALTILEQGRQGHFDPRVLSGAVAVLTQVHGEIARCGEAGVEPLADSLLHHYFQI